jgi:hypothetical protein
LQFFCPFLTGPPTRPGISECLHKRDFPWPLQPGPRRSCQESSSSVKEGLVRVPNQRVQSSVPEKSG